MSDRDTIFALSSGAPPAAIAVVRISGTAALATVAALTAGPLPQPRHAVLRTLRAPGEAVALDRALVLLFPGRASATGEDLAELHLHGGRAVVRAVMGRLGDMPGLRAAEAGEFTRRALRNGQIDLTEAEGLADLLSAETEAARRAAVTMAGGAVRRAVEGWSQSVLLLSARIEAELDFADEDDVPPAALAELQAEAATTAAEMAAVLAGPPVERVRDGVSVVLAGPPNSGKSTLFNALAGRDAAIVSPIAGTTRDRIEAWVERQGVGYTLVDTAGLVDASDDPIETIGVERARAAAEMADVVLWLGDDAPSGGTRLWLLPRADVRPGGESGRLPVSARTGKGLGELWQAIERKVDRRVQAADTFVCNHRQRSLIGSAAEYLQSAAGEADPLLLAESLRSARVVLDAVTGTSGTEQMLDALFGRFCIGK